MQNGTNRLRSTVRKSGKPDGDGGAGGDATMVWGGMPPDDGGGRESDGAKDCGAAQMVSGGMGVNGGDSGDSPGPTMRLQEASAEVFTALREAKEELADELEANLKQLKNVLEETQRIQKQMEAVLKEARCSPSLEEKATGRNRQAGPKQKMAPRNRPVKIADRKGQAERQGKPQAAQPGKNQSAPPWEQLRVGANQPPSWRPPHISTEAAGRQPAWQPPTEANPPQGGNQPQA